MRPATLALALLLLFSALLAAADVSDSDGTVDGNRFPVNGIPIRVRRNWMRRAMQIQINAMNTPCPAGPFGAIIVDHTVDPEGVQVCSNPGTGALLSSTDHGEMQAMRNCSDMLFASTGAAQGANYTGYWNKWSLYTTGEPCPMCAAASRWQRLREVVWSVSIRQMIDDGRPQISIPSWIVYSQSESLEVNVTSGIELWPFRTLGHVLEGELNVYFAWRFNPAAPCPAGCARAAAPPPGEGFPRCVKV